MSYVHRIGPSATYSGSWMIYLKHFTEFSHVTSLKHTRTLNLLNVMQNTHTFAVTKQFE